MPGTHISDFKVNFFSYSRALLLPCVWDIIIDSYATLSVLELAQYFSLAVRSYSIYHFFCVPQMRGQTNENSEGKLCAPTPGRCFSGFAQANVVVVVKDFIYLNILSAPSQILVPTQRRISFHQWVSQLCSLTSTGTKEKNRERMKESQNLYLCTLRQKTMKRK